jgi:hypothetical protein
VRRRSGLSVAPRFLWECLTSPTVRPFPAPATSNGAGGFPANHEKSSSAWRSAEASRFGADTLNVRLFPSQNELRPLLLASGWTNGRPGQPHPVVRARSLGLTPGPLPFFRTKSTVSSMRQPNTRTAATTRTTRMRPGLTGRLKDHDPPARMSRRTPKRRPRAVSGFGLLAPSPPSGRTRRLAIAGTLAPNGFSGVPG